MKATITHNTSGGYLQWFTPIGSGSKLYLLGSPLLSDMKNKDNCVTYTITVSGIDDFVSVSQFQLQVSGSRVGADYGNVTLFNTTEMGDIYLAGGKDIKIGVIDIDGTPLTFSVVVDFDGGTNGNATVSAYSESGKLIGTKELSVPSLASSKGVTSMLQWRDYLCHYRVWWNCSNGNGKSNGYLNIHKVSAIEGNIFA